MLRTNMYLMGSRLAEGEDNDFYGHGDDLRFLLLLKKGDVLLEERVCLGVVYKVRSYKIKENVVPRAPWRQVAERT